MVFPKEFVQEKIYVLKNWMNQLLNVYKQNYTSILIWLAKRFI